MKRANGYGKQTPWIVYILALLLASPVTLAVEEGTSIIGTQEAPNALNVVPWQNRELSVNPWDAMPTYKSDLLNDSLKPVDRDELRRQVEYFNLLRHSEPQPTKN